MTICLTGNHETYLAEFLSDPATLDSWKLYGGLTTLKSYGVRAPTNPKPSELIELSVALNSKMPPSHRSFLNKLKPFFTCGDFHFVHAGVRPGVSLVKQNLSDLLLIWHDFLSYEGDFGKIVIHGHTPVREPDIRSNRINIDTGAYATGQLTCLRLEDDQIKFV